MPSRLISYTLAARPVIALALPQSDLARTVNGSRGGWVVEPDQPELLATKIREVKAVDPAERVRRGRAGQDFALANSTREVCLPKIIAILEKVAV